MRAALKSAKALMRMAIIGFQPGVLPVGETVGSIRLRRREYPKHFSAVQLILNEQARASLAVR